MVFLRAADLGLSGGEGPGLIDSRVEVMVNLEQIRAEAAVRMGLARDRREASESVQAVPKVVLVASPLEYMDLKGEIIAADDCDIAARIISMGKTHRAFALTGAMCLAVAARIPGTVVHESARSGTRRHPPGTPLGRADDKLGGLEHARRTKSRKSDRLPHGAKAHGRNGLRARDFLKRQNYLLSPVTSHTPAAVRAAPISRCHPNCSPR